MNIRDIHPNNVKRIKRLRNLEGKLAYYLPTGVVTANSDLEYGTKVAISEVEVENHENKEETLVRVYKYQAYNRVYHSVFVKDLGFPHNPK